MSRLIEALTINLGTRISNISQDATRAQKNIIFNPTTRINRYVVLNLYITPYLHPLPDVNILTKRTPLTYFGIFPNVRKMPNFCSSTDLTRLIHTCAFVHKHAIIDSRRSHIVSSIYKRSRTIARSNMCSSVYASASEYPFVNGWKPSLGETGDAFRKSWTSCIEGRASSIPNPSP